MVIEALQRLEWSGKEILVSCSGGIDSMTLLHALVSLQLKPYVFHVNYGLRGKESDEDEQLVRELCQVWNLELHVERANPEHLKSPGVNLQNEARRIRMDFFQNWLREGDNRVVALAHHADDQEETFFLQFLRGAGFIGLGAMHVSRGNICRPFLALRKQQLVDWAVENGVKWREDRSNSTVVYARNKLRNVILPQLHEQLPNLNNSVLLLTQCFRDEIRAVELLVAPLLQKWTDDSAIDTNKWLSLELTAKEFFLHSIGIDTGQTLLFDELATADRGKELHLNHRLFYRSENWIAELKTKEESYHLSMQLVPVLPEIYSRDVLYLDADAIQGKLRLRKWMDQDFIEPLGMKGRQLVEKVLKDAGISHQKRNTIPVVSDDQNILWIPGIKVSRHFLAQKTTENILEVKCVGL